MGADINHSDEYNKTPLVNAARFSDLETIKLLLELGADINHISNKHDYYLTTPLIAATRWGTPNIVKYLIEAGATLDDET